MTSDMQADQTRAFQLLQEILLTKDRDKIQLLEAELEQLKLSLRDKEKLIATLEPAIADLLSKKIRDSKEEMAGAVAPVMGSAIKQQISEAKETIIDALYPVIGSTIRKAVSEAMKNLAKTVNEKIDQAMSFRMFRKKVQAKISGLSAADILLNESLPFQLHDIFYIHKDTGILLAHFQPDTQNIRTNKELLSGMLTAIRGFSTSAFKSKTERGLNVIEYDDLNIYLEDGRYAYLAVVTSGIASQEFYGHIHALEERCHQTFADDLRDFSGDISPFSETPAIISGVLGFDAVNTDKQAPVSRFGRYVVYVLILILISFTVYSFWPDNSPPAKKSAPIRFDENSFREYMKQSNPQQAALLKNVRIVIHDNLIFLEGAAPSERDALSLAKAAAHFSGNAVIVDRLNYQSALQNYVSKICVYFAKNSVAIDSAYANILEHLAERLKASDFSMLTVKGYSDFIGSPAVNIKISKKRARNIKQFLIANGVKPEKIFAIGFGSYGSNTDVSPATQAAMRCAVFEVN